ncbi:MAG: DNA replication/repair protein RecF [Clostridiales bacterium]|nr:DNA replication/repair protein RecF [Clostridiales bacterium]
MRVKKLTLKDFRNYERETVVFSPGVNVVVGDNAQGKTNLLEAIQLISIGRSMRTPRLGELIRFSASAARLSLEAEKKAGVSTVDMTLSGRDKRQVAVNGLPVSRLGELMGVVTTVLFSPDEIEIIKASPRIRRRFMDIALCQLSRLYFYTLSRYNKALNQRNRLLKSGEGRGDTLDVWDLQLAASGAKLIHMRRGFLDRLAAHARDCHAFLTDGGETLSIGYEGVAGGDEAEISANLTAELARTRDRDMLLKYTHAGPQGDDFWVKAGEIDLRKFGSQGQQRTAALSVKLAEVEMYFAQQGEYPVLLLDDVFSELDGRRQQKLKARVSAFQTLVTCTDAQFQTFPDAKVIRVSEGRIIRGAT